MNDQHKLPLTAKFALALFSVVISLALIEVALWLTFPQQTYGRAQALTAGYFRESELLIWELLPNFEGTAQAQEGEVVEYEVQINSLGFRDEEFSVEKPEDVYRIMTVGDSFTFGLAVDNGEDYPAQLEACLAERLYGPTRYEVINAGYASGFSPDSFYVFLDQIAPPYDIDFAIVGYLSVNDFLDLYDTVWAEEENGLPQRITSNTRDLNLQGQLTFRDTLPRYRIPILRNSHTFQLVMEVLLDNTTGLEGAVSPYDENPDIWLWVYLPQLPDELRALFDTSMRMLTAIQSLSQRDGYEMMVLQIPGGLQIHEPWWGDTEQYPNPYHGAPENAYPQKAVRTYLDEHDIEHYDLLPYMQGRRDFYNHPFGHWTPAGNRAAGYIVCDYMIEEHLREHLLTTGAAGLRGIASENGIDIYQQGERIGGVFIDDDDNLMMDGFENDYAATLAENTLTISEADGAELATIPLRFNVDGALVFAQG